MSIKARILIPFAIVLTIGVCGAAGIGAAALFSADGSARVVSTSLNMIDSASQVQDAFAKAEVLVTRVTAMTSIITADEIAASFTPEEKAIDDGVATLKSGALTPEMQAGVVTLTDASSAWRDTARALLGLDHVAELPTTELLTRRSAALSAAAAAIKARARSDAVDLTARADAAFRTNLMIIGGLIALVLGVLAIFGYRIVGRVGSDLKQMSMVMQDLSEGQLEIDIPGTGRADELGAMAGAIAIFREALAERRRLEGEQTVESGVRAKRAKGLEAFQTQLADVLDQAAAGDFSGRLDSALIDAEFRQFADRVNNLLLTVEQGLSETGRVLAALARTDLTQRVEGDYQGAFGQLKDDTNGVGEKLTSIVMSLRETSQGLKAATGEILLGSNNLSERTTQQAATIEETSATMEKLAGTVVANAKRAGDASANAALSTRTAEESGKVMLKANDAMERITASSAKISNIIGMIDDIAFQTNLLALNASVEAARAGEMGKGFAVVAVEVRRLAQSAAQASSEVKGLIEQSSGEVKNGTKLVAEVAAKLEAMLTGARTGSALMDGIARESRDQSLSIEGVSDAVRQLDEMTQHNAALVEQTNAAIEQTESQARELDRIVGLFTIETTPAHAAEPAAVGIKGLQQRVRGAARSYLGRDGMEQRRAS